MRTGKNAEGFPPKPWTIIATPRGGKVGITHYYYAYNLLTRQSGPYRDTYDAAMRDIETGYVSKHNSPWAEPWGL